MLTVAESHQVVPVSAQTQEHHGAETLTSRTLRGLKWTYLATLSSGILQLGVTATMSRLLTPADYGLIAAAGLFLAFGSYFSEMGVGQALVQKLEIEEQDIRAAFTASATIGLLATAVMCLCAPLARLIVNTSDVVALVRLLSVSLALNGMASTSLNLLRRNLRFDVLSKIEVASYAISYGVLGIPLAIAHFGVWALTAVLLSQPVLTLSFAFGYQKHTVRPCLRWSPYKRLLSFGYKLSLTSFVEYFFFLAESCFVGRFWGGVVLGIYNRATMVANLPGSHLSAGLMKVLFPAFSRAQEDKRRLASAYLQGLAAISLITVPVAVGMIPAARDLVLTVLGAKFVDAAPLVQIIVVSLPIGIVAAMASTVTNAMGKVGARLVLQVVLCGLMWGGVFVAAGWGVRSLAVASIIVQIIRTIALLYLAQKALLLKWREVVAALLPGVVLALLVATAIFGVRWGLPTAIPVLRLLAEISAAGLVWMSFCYWCLPAQIRPFVIRILDSSRIVERLPFMAVYRARIAVGVAESS